MAPILLSIEGNIGSGKSTFLRYLREEGNLDELGTVCFLEEPVDEWNEVKDENGKTILEKYYEDQAGHAFTFQMMAYISRLNKLKEALAKNYDVIVAERSLQTDRVVFAQMLKDDKKISEIEFAVYLKWFDAFTKDIPDVNVIYLRTSPHVAFARVLKRAREGETIPLEYLEKCHDYHDNWHRDCTQLWLHNSWLAGDWVVFDANQDLGGAQTDWLAEWRAGIVDKVTDLRRLCTSYRRPNPDDSWKDMAILQAATAIETEHRQQTLPERQTERAKQCVAELRRQLSNGR